MEIQGLSREISHSLWTEHCCESGPALSSEPGSPQTQSKSRVHSSSCPFALAQGWPSALPAQHLHRCHVPSGAAQSPAGSLPPNKMLLLCSSAVEEMHI